ncbi:MAG: hypothetical protein AAF563_11540 [Pseudomonadota bacterium]
MWAIRASLALAMLVMFATSSAAEECAEAVQGRIAWDYDGRTSWAPDNVRRLCHGAESIEPAMCFLRVMHGGVNHGGGVRWMWQNAIDLCEQSTDATWTVACFQRQIQHGQSWQNALPACDERAVVFETLGGDDETGGAVIVRRVLPDGKVESRFPDGTIRLDYAGGFTIITPDGQEQIMLFQDVQGATPPSTPPDTAHADWLSQQNESLLIIISTLVGDDEASVNNYLANESAGSSAYEKIDRHIDTINLLVSP